MPQAANNPGIAQMTGGPNIFDDVLKALDKNGDLPETEWKRAQVLLFAELGRRTKPISEIKKKVDKIESHSILLMARNHPKSAISVIAIIAIFTIAIISHLELWIWFGQVFTDITGISLP
jgi:hypothetical protein